MERHFENGAEREVLEETGIKLDIEKLQVISVTNDIVPKAHFVTIGFLYNECDQKPQVMEPDEITKWEWFDLDSLPEPLFEPSRKIVKNYKDNTFYKN